MQTISEILKPLEGMTNGQLQPFADAAGISVHTVRNALLNKAKSPRYVTVLKLMEIAKAVEAARVN